MNKLKESVLRIDYLIGRLDRVLSEFLGAASCSDLDVIDAMTLRHHADDLIGVGTKALEILKERGLK